MYSAERKQEILKLITKDSRVSVSDLADHFGVSRASIRRDLNDLHSAGLLQRTYGGALRPLDSDEAPFDERQVSHPDEKARIGQTAARLVQPGTTVFIDGGTTCESLAGYLAGKAGFRVVTYGLNIAVRLVGQEQITVIVIGGTLQHRSLTLGGVLADEGMQAYNMRFDLAFVSASGVSAAEGVTNASFEEIPMKRKAIAAARQVILLADSSKIGVVAAGLVVPVQQIARLITGRDAAPVEVAALQAAGLSVDLV